jgi:hypothetical protein
MNENPPFSFSFSLFSSFAKPLFFPHRLANVQGVHSSQFDNASKEKREELEAT